VRIVRRVDELVIGPYAALSRRHAAAASTMEWILLQA
jgi:hypothetical protein